MTPDRLQANLGRVISLGRGWYLGHAKSATDVKVHTELFRNLTDKGPLKFYHRHGELFSSMIVAGHTSPYARRCFWGGCKDYPSRDVIGRAVWLARARNKHVLGYKNWTPSSHYP